jgi:hypothetical protein
VVLAGLTAGCFGDPGVVRASIHDQRLASGKVVKVVSCVLAWGDWSLTRQVISRNKE